MYFKFFKRFGVGFFLYGVRLFFFVRGYRVKSFRFSEYGYFCGSGRIRWKYYLLIMSSRSRVMLGRKGGEFILVGGWFGGFCLAVWFIGGYV